VPLGDSARVKRLEETQAKIKKLEAEAKTKANSKVEELTPYLVAAWKVRAAKQQDIAAIAAADKLDAAVLARCVKFVEKAPNGFEVMRKTSAAEKDVVTAAQAMQKQAKTSINKKGQLDKNNKELLDKLFYADDSVFQLSDAMLTKLRNSDDAKPLPITHGLAETAPANMKVFLRGNPAKLGDEAPRRFLKVLAGDDPAKFTQGSGRLELANAIASKDNPLTARVMVNRVWQYHFGRPLVGTPSNFGALGDRPTHPELLDYLAVAFMENGWSFKKLHRAIMLSSVYQLSAERDEKNFNQDGDNRWLWRQNRRRLDVESWRDAMLAAAGKLDRTLGGPTTNLAAVDNNRRTVYAKISRHDLNHVLRLFDFPDANITSERRVETTVPQQQLFVLNSPFVIETAKAFAARVQKEAASDTERIQRAFQLAYGRPASAEESRLFETFLQGQDAEPMANRLSRWERVAQILIGSNEFMYVD
jgi:hypothetical protein